MRSRFVGYQSIRGSIYVIMKLASISPPSYFSSFTSEMAFSYRGFLITRAFGGVGGLYQFDYLSFYLFLFCFLGENMKGWDLFGMEEGKEGRKIEDIPKRFVRRMRERREGYITEQTQQQHSIFTILNT